MKLKPWIFNAKKKKENVQNVEGKKNKWKFDKINKSDILAIVYIIERIFLVE